MVTSKVVIKNDIPILTVNGQEISSNAYITYFTPRARYDDFVEAGYKLFSVPIFFASRTLQVMGPAPAFYEGIFDTEGKPDFSIADRIFGQVLECCPDAMILPRINVSLPGWWEEAHPEELCDNGYFDDKRPCFSSDLWAEQTKVFLGEFLEHMQSTPYRDHVIGYQIAGGNTEEWFPFDMNGSLGRRSREKFEADCLRKGIEQSEAEYYRFLSKVIAERICEFAAYVKEKTCHELVVGSFYGYTLECVTKEKCHHALHVLLSCEDIDFICSPVSYAYGRALGQAHGYMLPIDSLKLHGKLYFSENDTRTHLTRIPFEVPYYQKPVWEPRNFEETMEMLKMHYARALTHGHALWWFDMWGGWYHDGSYMSLFAKMLEITSCAKNKNLRSVAEVAFLIDETGFCHLNDAQAAPFGKIQRALGLMGTPFDMYLTSDYEAVKDRYKAWIIAVPYHTAVSERVLSEVKKQGITAMVIGSEEAGQLEAATLRSFCKNAGVHIYCEKDAVVYVNESYLFLHTHEEAVYQLHLPEGKKLKSVMGEGPVIFPAYLPKCKGYLYELYR